MHRAPARHYLLFLAFLVVVLPATAHANEGHGIDASVWLTVAGIILAAMLGGELAVRLKQPPVLGQLVAGIAIGNLHHLGGHSLLHVFEGAPELPSVALLAELGVVLLLFEVGLESTLTEMRKVAPQSGLVAVIGVVAPMVLGYGASLLLLPDAPAAVHLFVGATLCATSVGITASVLQDLKVMHRAESKVILGAAVIDDVLGLIVLAVVAGIGKHGTVDAATLGVISLKATGFLLGALLLGAFVMPGVFNGASKLRSRGILAAIAIALCLLLAGASAAAGLAAIVGAFAAGLVLDEVHVRPFGVAHKHDLSPLVAPIVAFLAPVFFVRTGMLVDLSGVSMQPLLLALALSVVAVVGKLVSGFGVRGKMDRLTVGVGMIPRGEVGLIFADTGRSIRMPDGENLISPPVYMAVVLVVMLSTIVSPPWLAHQLARVLKREGGTSPETSAAEH